MKTSYKIFLLAVEERNLTKAAQKAHVSQQCISAHIKKLEEIFGVKLLIRKPRFHLTAAGEMLERSLRQVQNIERVLDINIQEIKNESKGKVVLGISPSRAQILLPDFIIRYNSFFPNVEIECVTADTAFCEKLLIEGKIDAFLGVNPTTNPLFEIIPLAKETLYFIATDVYLEQYYSGNFKKDKKLFSEGIDLRFFQTGPYVLNSESSPLWEIIKRHTDNLRIKLLIPYRVSTHGPQIEICGKGLAAAFCPLMILKSVEQYNKMPSSSKKINVFPLKYLDEGLRLDIVLYKNPYQTRYFNKFIELLSQECQKTLTSSQAIIN